MGMTQTQTPAEIAARYFAAEYGSTDTAMIAEIVSELTPEELDVIVATVEAQPWLASL